MVTISVIYHSGSGTTTFAAKEIIQGAIDAGATVHDIFIEGKDIVEGRYKNESVFAKLAESDAIIFGSPTYMGSVSGQFKSFMDATGAIWMKQGWKDKVAGGFTVSGSPSGDKVNTLFQLVVLSQQHGMVWVGPAQANDGSVNKLGGYVGAIFAVSYGQKFDDAGDISYAKEYGKRIVQKAELLVK